MLAIQETSLSLLCSHGRSAQSYDALDLSIEDLCESTEVKRMVCVLIQMVLHTQLTLQNNNTFTLFLGMV